MATEAPTYRYRVDAADILVDVDARWLAFAQENGAPELTEDTVVGRLLWEFVAGEELCQLYLAIHARVRSAGKPVVLPFRCDSPTLQRHMRMTITGEEAGHLQYECLLVRAVPRRGGGALDDARPRSNAFLTMCSCCKRTLLEPLGWLEVEDVSARLGLFETEHVPKLRHTLCPECKKILGEATNNETAA
jgi:hypothetical protein